MERFGQQVIARKGPLLGLFLALSLLAAFFAVQFRLTADIDRWQPSQGEFAATQIRFAQVLPGSNRLLVALEPRQGDIWNQEFFSAYKKLTEDVAALPGIAPRSVLSLWRTGVRYIRSRDDRLGSLTIIPGNFSDMAMPAERLEQIRLNLLAPGFGRRFVAQDFSAALVEAEFQRGEVSGWSLSEARDFAQKFDELRKRYDATPFRLHVLAPGEEMARLSQDLPQALFYAAITLAFLCFILWLFCGSLVASLAVLVSSLAAAVWTLGAINYFLLRLDPATLWAMVFFTALSFAWGLLQLSRFAVALEAGASPLRAGRATFIGGFLPGLLAGLVMLFGLSLLTLLSIPAIRDMAMGGVIALAALLLANLFLLPLLLASVPETGKITDRLKKSPRRWSGIARFIAHIAGPRASRAGFFLTFLLASLTLLHILFPAALPFFSPQKPFTPRLLQDVPALSEKFPASTNLYTIIVEAKAGACTDYDTLHYLEEFGWHMANVEGVRRAASIADAVKLTSSMWNESNPRWRDLPRNKFALIQAVQPIPVSSRLLNIDCSIMPVRLNLIDGRARTLLQVSEAADKFRQLNPAPEGMSVHLAMGEQGERAGSKIELYQMQDRLTLLFFLVLLSALALVYRDWRALLACGVPLLLAALAQRMTVPFVQAELLIGNFAIPILVSILTALFVIQIYARLRLGMKQGLNASDAYRAAASEAALPLAFAVAGMLLGFGVWALSPAPLQAELGLQFASGIFWAGLAAFILLPALAVRLEIAFPRRASL